MEPLIQSMLLVSALVTMVTAVMQLTLWLMHHSVSNRVTKLEAMQNNAMTHAETIRIYERLSGIESTMGALGDSVRSIQHHLMEDT